MSPPKFTAWLLAALTLATPGCSRRKATPPPPLVAREAFAAVGPHRADVYGWLVFPQADGRRNLLLFLRFAGPDAVELAQRAGSGARLTADTGAECRVFRDAPLVKDANPAPDECVLAFELVAGVDGYVFTVPVGGETVRFRVAVADEDTAGEAAMGRLNEGRKKVR